MIRKSAEELYSKTCQSLTLQQTIVLKPNMHYGRQDTTSSDARTSFDHPDRHGGTYIQTCRGEMDFRIQGLSHSTVQVHDHTRNEAIQKLIHQFETHPNRKALQTDLKAKSSIQPSQRATEGNDLQHGKHGVLRDVRDHSQSAVPQLCGILDEKHCIMYLRNTNNVIKKGPSHGVRHGNTERQRIYHAAHVSPAKAKKNGYKSMLDRLLKQPSLSRITNPKTTCARFVAIVSEDHSKIATAAELSDVKMLGCLCSTVQELDGGGTLLQPNQAHLRRGGNHLKTGGRHGVGMNSDFSFNPSVKVFRLQAMAIPL